MLFIPSRKASKERAEMTGTEPLRIVRGEQLDRLGQHLPAAGGDEAVARAHQPQRLDDLAARRAG